MLRKIHVFKTRCEMQISPPYHLWLFYGIFYGKVTEFSEMP